MRTVKTIIRSLRFASFAFLLVSSAEAARAPYLDVQAMAKADLRKELFSDAIRIKNLSAEYSFIVSRTTAFEPNAMIGTLLRGNSIAQTFAATDLLPPGSFAVKTTGQIYSAALLDDNQTLAISIGWTNAKQRNINGVAILTKADGEWRADHVIAVAGGVRDITSGPANSLVAVTTDALRSRKGQDVSLVTVFDRTGLILNDTLKASAGQDWDATAEQAIGTVAERVGTDTVALLSPNGSSKAVTLTRTGACERVPGPRADEFFVYPRTSSSPCLSATVSQLNTFSDLPPDAELFQPLVIRAMHMNADRSTTIVREGFNGSSTRVFVTRYGGKPGLSSWSADAMWKAIRITDDTVEAMEISADGDASIVRSAAP